MKTIFRFLILLSLLLPFGSIHSENPKREFRGAWLHIIGQSQWQNKTVDQTKKYIIDQLNKLQEAGCNAVIFQVRPTADAFYISELEPWTKWYTGSRGKAPDPLWDPMAFTIEEAHKRGMEFHAWMNPYRVTSGNETLPASHDANKEPWRFMRYNGMVFFDPAYQENRDFICEVVADIVTRYDIDAIHMDDYFYPYPKQGSPLPDNDSYKQFGNGMSREDWRRDNVNKLIKQLNTTIKDIKPWVRFGISPFGIWRNKKNDPRGSESNGLQNYDNLYADILLWAKNGWVDYLAPQLYWELDLKVAPSRHLAKWWNDNSYGVDVYIGQDVNRTMKTADPGNHDKNELATKVKLSRDLPNVKGNIWWHGYWVTENLKGVKDSLANKHQSTIALPPAYGDKSKKPAPVKDLKIVKENNNIMLTWTPPASGSKESETDAVKFLVYEFFPDEKPDLENSEAIINMTPDSRVKLNSVNEESSLSGSTFVVTAIDRMNRESEPIKITVK